MSWANHRHCFTAWEWFSGLANDNLFFCRITQLGLLRLLTTAGVMGDEVLTVGAAWNIYDRWLEDRRITMRHEPAGIHTAFRAATQPLARLSAPKAIVDAWLLALSQTTRATLVTFDKGPASAGRKSAIPVLLLNPRSS